MFWAMAMMLQVLNCGLVLLIVLPLDNLELDLVFMFSSLIAFVVIWLSANRIFSLVIKRCIVLLVLLILN